VPAFQVFIYYILVSVIYRGGERSIDLLSAIVVGITHFQIITLLQSNTGSILLGNGSILKSIQISPIILIMAGFLRSIGMFLPSVVVGLAYLLLKDDGKYFVDIPCYIFFLGVLVLAAWPIALLIATTTLYIRDIERLYPLGCQIMMYSCPVIYLSGFVPDRVTNLYYCNPLAVIFGWIQYGLIGGGHPPKPHTLIAIFAILLLNVLAFVVYRSLSKNITKQI